MRVHIDAPASADPLDIAKAVVGPHTLLKAEATGPARNPFSRWKALSELYSKVEDMYRAQAKRMVRAVVRYIESIHGRKLAKAEGGPNPLPLLTPEQLEAVAQIIRDHHTGFAIRIGADTAETQDEIQRLLDDGLLPPEALDIIEDSYHYGQVVGSLRQFDETKRAKDFSYDEFKKRIERRPVSVDAHDREAMDWAKHSVAIHCRGLGNRIADDLSTTIIDADAELRRKYVTEIRDATEANIERHQTWRRLASDLGHKTEDWTRDMMRIAATEKQNAFQEGFSQSLIEREGDPDTVYVAKIPSPSACKDCVRLHLTQGQGSAPRVFLLSELHNNGTNVGRKRAEWLPTVGTVHPFCHRPDSLVVTADGPRELSFIRPGDLVLTHKGRFRPVERVAKRSYRRDLVKIFVGNEAVESTPEHPYLTQRGWIAAADLQPGDDLVKVLELSSEEVRSYNHPTQRFEVDRLVHVLRDLSLGRVPRGVYLYGDENVGQRKIDVERAYRHLRSRVESFFAKSVEYLCFVFREAAVALSRLGRSDLLLDWSGFASDRGVGLVYHGSSTFSVEAAPHQSDCFGLASDSNPVFSKVLVDGLSTDPVSLSKIGRRGTGFVAFGDLVDGQLSFGRERNSRFSEATSQGVLTDTKSLRDRRDPPSSFVGLDRSGDVDLDLVHRQVHYHGVPVKSIGFAPYDGEVYSLSVAEDESYVVDGFVVHNCACELVHVPPGWKFAKKPPEGEGWTKVPGKSGAWRRKDGDYWKHWSPDLEPELELERSEASFARDLKKAIMRYRNVPDDELSIRVGDPVLCQEIEKVVARTPRELFTSRTGVTLITTDIARVGSELALGDLAYWTGNEIRISQTLPPEKLAFVLEHEFGHAPNVFLLHRLGSEPEVRRWHDDLYEVSRGEGYVSHYAKVHPIENSAEVTRLYLYARGYLMGRYPRQFEYVHRDYRDLFGDRVQVA